MSKWNAKNASKYLNQYVTLHEVEDAAFSVYYWGIQPEHYDNSIHKHSFYEVCYVLSGEGAYIERGSVFPLKEGTIFYSRPGTFHQIRSGNGMYLLYVAFELKQQCSDERKRDFSLLLENESSVVYETTDQTTALLWRALVQEADAAIKADDADVKRLACSLLNSIPYCFISRLSLGTKSMQRESSSLLMKQAKLFIEDNLDQHLTMHSLSANLHISERHLGRLFSSETGQTFSHFLQEKRVQKARELMDRTSLSIAEIAAQTGFKTVHYFTRVFTEKMGIPPGIYRRGNFPAYPRKNKHSE
ncbi:AraC family transcriptional regulator [Paenibacillus sp. N3.4]|uniref:AraC family transcriptional regulator n=1 Tax=Paenibacillus sp. N3.4 TaxID=2603222 RepID=UPI0011C85160|nr:AraC family transcriptional regulator [Paenibacillus sp. N3.4]TXK83799.1 AraC family transcriptional regulator [Paenibacillus sp. N3.4]